MGRDAKKFRIIPGHHKYPASVQMDAFELLVILHLVCSVQTRIKWGANEVRILWTFMFLLIKDTLSLFTLCLKFICGRSRSFVLLSLLQSEFCCLQTLMFLFLFFSWKPLGTEAWSSLGLTFPRWWCVLLVASHQEVQNQFYLFGDVETDLWVQVLHPEHLTLF